MSNICDEYECLPSEAIRELQNDDDHVATKIISMRQFHKTLRFYRAWCDDRSKDKKPLPDDDPMLELVLDIEFGLVDEEISGSGGEE